MELALSVGAFVPWIALVAGAAVGSFVNVVVFRLPRGISIVRPRSFCPACGQPVDVRVNLPVLGYLLARGRCLRCKALINPMYPFVEAFSGVAALYLARRYQPLDALARFALAEAMIAAGLIDLEWRIIPNAITLPGVVLGFLAGAFAIQEVGPMSAAIGVTAGAGFLLIVNEAYRLIRGREGIGMGDIKFLAMVGAALGWPGALFTLFVGSLMGSIVGILAGSATGLRKLSGAERSRRLTVDGLDEPRAGGPAILTAAIPFGPFLAVAGLTYDLFQPSLLYWYLG